MKVIIVNAAIADRAKKQYLGRQLPQRLLTTIEADAQGVTARAATNIAVFKDWRCGHRA